MTTLGRRVSCCSPSAVLLVQLCSSCEKYPHYLLVATFTCQHECRATLRSLAVDTRRNTHHDECISTHHWVPAPALSMQSVCADPMASRTSASTQPKVKRCWRGTANLRIPRRALRSCLPMSHLPVDVRLMMNESLYNCRMSPLSISKYKQGKTCRLRHRTAHNMAKHTYP